MRILKKAAIVLAAVSPLMMANTNANAVGGGAAAFAGFVNLATFPCGGGPECEANFTSTVAAGAGISTDGGGSASVVTGINATVNYSEICTAGEALQGTANGVATLTGINLTGSLLPLDAPFQWIRVGLTAIILPAPLPGGDPAVVGAAVFVPTSGVPACTGGSVDAVVAGAAVLVDL